MGILRTIRGYIAWTYERGSLHYDVMVTLILVFVFVAPHYVNFKDQPGEPLAHPIDIVVNPDGEGGFSYEVQASKLGAHTAEDLDQALLRVIEPVAGEVTMLGKTAVTDRKGQVTAYIVRVRRH